MTESLDWRPTASLQILRTRARVLSLIRAFFAERGVLEVETPILSAAAVTAPYLESFVSRFVGPGAADGRPLYLHTSPEFPMKRLLAAGSGPIYQIARVFRQGEAGRFHNPEFTMLEWYRPGLGHHQLMDEVEALVTGVLAGRLSLRSAERLSYREMFVRFAGVDPFSADIGALKACATRHGIAQVAGLGEHKDAWLDLLLSHVIEPLLGHGQLTFIYDYPASQAALAKVRRDEPPVAERFELYLHGVELANGFHELSDAGEQQRRFEQELAERQQAGLEQVPLDHRLIAALQSGLPQCSGVALGVDRLTMAVADATHIDQVIAFPLAIA